MPGNIKVENSTSIHLVVEPVLEDISKGEPPRVISCKVLRVEGTLVVLVDANSPDITHDAFIDGMFEKLRRPRGRAAALGNREVANANPGGGETAGRRVEEK